MKQLAKLVKVRYVEDITDSERVGEPVLTEPLVKPRSCRLQTP